MLQLFTGDVACIFHRAHIRQAAQQPTQQRGRLAAAFRPFAASCPLNRRRRTLPSCAAIWTLEGMPPYRTRWTWRWDPSAASRPTATGGRGRAAALLQVGLRHGCGMAVHGMVVGKVGGKCPFRATARVVCLSRASSAPRLGVPLFSLHLDCFTNATAFNQSNSDSDCIQFMY